jgi:hypothetical protein
VLTASAPETWAHQALRRERLGLRWLGEVVPILSAFLTFDKHCAAHSLMQGVHESRRWTLELEPQRAAGGAQNKSEMIR